MTGTTNTEMSLPKGILKAVRPKQWAKNSLVFIAPAAANAFVSKGPDGVEFHGTAIWQAIFAFVVFSMVASGTYLINDSVDVDADRRHPTKRNRPIAAGVVSIKLAVSLAVVLTIAGIGLGLWRSWEFGLVVAIYAVQTLLYSFWLKNEPVLDVVALSGGFILRLLGGAYAVDVEVSDWFFIIACFGALFVAVGKRMAEKRELGDDPATIRKTLAVYTDAYLRFLQGVAVSVLLVAYVMWAFDHGNQYSDGGVWMTVSILPFVVAILRYSLLVELGEGSAPEEIFFSDRQMQVMGLLWVLCVGIGFYVSG